MSNSHNVVAVLSLPLGSLCVGVPAASHTYPKAADLPPSYEAPSRTSRTRRHPDLESQLESKSDSSDAPCHTSAPCPRPRPFCDAADVKRVLIGLLVPVGGTLSPLLSGHGLFAVGRAALTPLLHGHAPASTLPSAIGLGLYACSVTFGLFVPRLCRMDPLSRDAQGAGALARVRASLVVGGLVGAFGGGVWVYAVAALGAADVDPEASAVEMALMGVCGLALIFACALGVCLVSMALLLVWYAARYALLGQFVPMEEDRDIVLPV